MRVFNVFFNDVLTVACVDTKVYVCLLVWYLFTRLHTCVDWHTCTQVSCEGVKPELELDRKVLQFDQVLIQRKEKRSLYLRNKTHMPVAWRFSGLETLGEDFTFSQETGVVQPLKTDEICVYFRSMKPISVSRKTIRIEVFDVDNIIGIVQTEHIQVTAEAYDVSLDMSFPRSMLNYFFNWFIW